MRSHNSVRGRILQVSLDRQNVNKTLAERRAQISHSIHSATLGNILPRRQSLIADRSFLRSQTEVDKPAQISFVYDGYHQNNILDSIRSPKPKNRQGPIQK